MDKPSASAEIAPMIGVNYDSKSFEGFPELDGIIPDIHNDNIQVWDEPSISSTVSSPTVVVNIYVKRSAASLSPPTSTTSTLSPVSSSSLVSSTSTPAIVTTVSNSRSAPASALDLVSRGKLTIPSRLNTEARRAIARFLSWDSVPAHILLCVPGQLQHVSPKFLTQDTLVSDGTDLVVTVSNLPACHFASARKKRCYKASPADKLCLCGPATMTSVRKRKSPLSDSSSGSGRSSGASLMSDTSSSFTASPVISGYGSVPPWSSPEFLNPFGALQIGSGGASVSRQRHHSMSGTGVNEVYMITKQEWSDTQTRLSDTQTRLSDTQTRLSELERQVIMLRDTIHRLTQPPATSVPVPTTPLSTPVTATQ